jgi:hypothetical protein
MELTLCQRSQRTLSLLSRLTLWPLLSVRPPSRAVSCAGWRCGPLYLIKMPSLLLYPAHRVHVIRPCKCTLLTSVDSS